MTQHARSPFDEQAALAELERLQEAIQSARRQRMQAAEDFDTFVRTMRQQPPGDSGPARHVRSSDSPRVSGAVQSEPPALPLPPLPTVTPLALASSADDRPALIVEEPVMVETYVRGLRRRPHQIAVAVIAVFVVAGIFLLFPRSDTPPETGQARESAPAASPEPAPAAAVPTSSAPAPAALVDIELTTVRRVWLRVIVDGERVIEQEVAAGERFTYSANRGISVRAGDAGAVQVRVGTGDPEPLGRDGFPVTRSFP